MSMHAKYEVSVFYGSKVIANVKLTTDKQIEKIQQTNRQRGHNNMHPNLSMWDIKMLCIFEVI